MAQAKITTDHAEIRKWRGGPRPAPRRRPLDAVEGRYRDNPHRISQCPECEGRQSRGDHLDEFFEKFDESNLALLYQEETASGQRSNFNKLVGRETAEAREDGETHASRHHGRR